MKQQYIFPVDRCVMCGDPVPEGRQVCQICSQTVSASSFGFMQPIGIKPPTLLTKLRYFVTSLKKQGTKR